MDLGPELTAYERRFAHAWGARVVLMALGSFFVLLFGFLPKVGPVLALGLLGGLGWLGFKTFVGARVKLVVLQGGFRWEGNGAQLEAPWSALQDVRFSQANVLVSGVPVSHNMSLAVQLVSGEKFELITRETMGRQAIGQFMERSRPYVEAKLAEVQRSGGPLSFGDVTIDGEALVYRGKRFPWGSLNGYRVDQGHLMVDVDRQAPRMAFKVPFHRISNLESMLERLAQHLPQGDYDQFPLDESKFSLLRTTAATHDPRYLSRGQRLMVLASPLVVIPLFIVYALISVPFASKHQEAMNEFFAEEKKLDDAVSARLEAMTPVATPLREACADAKLALLADEVTVRIGPKEPKLGFLKSEKQSFVTVIDASPRMLRPISLSDAMFELLGDPPWEWGRRAGYVAQKRVDEPFTALVRVRSLVAPVREGYSSWKPGQLTLDVGFLGRDGKLRCEGSTTVTYPKDLSSSSSEGDLWEQGVVAGALLEVCDRFGQGYCEQAQQFVTAGALPAAPSVTAKTKKRR